MNARLIAKATVIEAAGNLPKVIEEFVGRVNSGTEALSIARMSSPTGWIEPGQTPEFDEYTVVLRGLLRVTTRTGVIDVAAGQAVISPRGQWVQYSTPGVEGARIYRRLRTSFFSCNCAPRRLVAAISTHPSAGLFFPAGRAARLLFLPVNSLIGAVTLPGRSGGLRRLARFRRNGHGREHFSKLLQAIALILALVTEPLAG